MIYYLLASILFLLIVDQSLAKTCAWQNCPKWSTAPGAINVHLIAHTHDDLGWIKTADDYYTGAKPLLVPVGVQFILNTVIEELDRDPSRRFTYAETGFLYRWLIDHDQKHRDLLHRLITETGQLELIGGGWTQPDEACTHYLDLIDQYSLGLGILNETYGTCGHPKVAWQIDPFGHSREHANLAALMGYEALFFSRMHYKELEKRAKEKSLEMIWSASEELKTNILTGGFLRGTYAPPDGMCFDALCANEPIIDNPVFENYNLDMMLERFYNTVKKEVETHRHGHVMVTMGGDFQYSNANMWFTQLDKLIAAVNARTSTTNMTTFYSTPGCYVEAVNSAQPHLTAKSDDFFPYASSNHSYWTGYFTSKPALKGIIRESSSFLQLVRQFSAFSTSNSEKFSALDNLEQAQALCTHHDAVTGTSKENVTQDYIRGILKGWTEAESLLNASFWHLATKNSSASFGPNSLQFCRLANESICEATKTMANFSLILFNGNSQPADLLVRVPFYRKSAKVLDDKGQEVPAELIKTFLRGSDQPLGPDSAPFELNFRAQIPALGFRTYFVIGSDRRKRDNFAVRKQKMLKQLGLLDNDQEDQPANLTVISNNLFQLTFSEDGLLHSVKDLRRGRTHRLRQQFFHYRGVSNSSRSQASGAYIFRPNGTEPYAIQGQVQLQAINNTLVQEARQTVGPWLSQIIRLVPGKPYIEFDFIIGPLPKNLSNLETIEVVTRYTLEGMQNQGLFWTDANGRQMIKRSRNDSAFFEGTEPVAANYYPVNSRILIEDDKDRMVVLMDRSQGGTSLVDGQLEIMLHRRAFWDDGWGVEEALDEPGQDGRGLIVRGRHWLLLSDPSSSEHRPLAMEMFHSSTPQMMAFGHFDGTSVAGYSDKFRTEFSGLASPLPPNVQILTLRPLDKDHVLLRLEHFYQAREQLQPGETENLGAEPVEVNLQKLFELFTVLSVEELGLAGNVAARHGGPRRGPGGLVVQLRPMEIRTFRVQIGH